MRSAVLSALMVALIASGLEAQAGAPMVITSVGTPQVVPSPPGTGGFTGSADMAASWYNQLNQRLLTLRFRYISATGYVFSGYASETVFLYLNFGSAALPGITVLGGKVLIPLTPTPIANNLGGVTWNGPGDTVAPTSSGGTGAFCPFTGTEPCNYGKIFSITVPVSLSGIPLTAQYFLYDAAINRVYSSNALNLIAP